MDTKTLAALATARKIKATILIVFSSGIFALSLARTPASPPADTSAASTVVVAADYVMGGDVD